MRDVPLYVWRLLEGSAGEKLDRPASGQRPLVGPLRDSGGVLKVGGGEAWGWGAVKGLEKYRSDLRIQCKDNTDSTGVFRS
jgi:hypothetical protein